MHNPYIHELIKDEHLKYNCQCLVVDDTKILDGVGFRLKGQKIKDLWYMLENSKHNWNYEFHFELEKNLTMEVIVRDKKRINALAEKLDWPKLFLDD